MSKADYFMLALAAVFLIVIGVRETLIRHGLLTRSAPKAATRGPTTAGTEEIDIISLPKTPAASSAPPRAPLTDAKETIIMSMKDDAAAFVAKGSTAIDAAVTAALAEAKKISDAALAAKDQLLTDAQADAVAAKAIYEKALSDLQAKYEALTTPADKAA